MDTLPKKGNIVIDGLRFADDYAFLIEMFGPAFRHVHVETSEQIRKTRFEMREAGGMSFQEAELHPVEQHIQVLRTLAHEVITNNGTVQDLYSHIAGLLPFPYEAVEV
jgi:dephospho-CoA kinase